MTTENAKNPYSNECQENDLNACREILQGLQIGTMQKNSSIWHGTHITYMTHNTTKSM